jgi:glycosyltransferase involved in cell wall biosynthesis
MNYDPNVRGAVWLTREVWPLVRAEHPDARLMLIGATPAAAVRALANEPSGVVVTGTVPDVKLYLWNAAVAVAPLLIARGVQNKVLEAVAAGVPCVVTQPVAEGLPREVHDACRVGADARAFANAICEVLRLSPSARRDMAAKADLRGLAWPGRLEALIELLGDAARRRSRSDAGQPHRTASAARK